jgi:hypothetical protein
MSINCSVTAVMTCTGRDLESTGNRARTTGTGPARCPRSPPLCASSISETKLKAEVLEAEGKGGHQIVAEEMLLWGWRGTPFEPDELEGLDLIRTALTGELGDQLRRLLSAAELRATRRRVEALIVDGCFPLPSPNWPAIPWPPF